LAKGRSLSLPLSHGTSFRMNSRKLNALQLLNVSLKHFYSSHRIFKTDYVMRLWSTSRRRTKSHHFMLLCYVILWFEAKRHQVLLHHITPSLLLTSVTSTTIHFSFQYLFDTAIIFCSLHVPIPSQSCFPYLVCDTSDSNA